MFTSFEFIFGVGCGFGVGALVMAIIFEIILRERKGK